MVLAAMLEESVKRKAREEGFKEGYEEGFKEGREEGRKEGLEEVRKERREKYLKRWHEACAKFGVEVDGVPMLPWTPEVEQFLDSDAEG